MKNFENQFWNKIKINNFIKLILIDINNFNIYIFKINILKT